MEPIFRCGTKKAMQELAAELNLTFENWMQDWPIEVIEPNDIKTYIEHYEKLADNDKKFVLMEGILDAIEYQPSEELFLKYWNRVKGILVKDFFIHEYTIYKYACFDAEDIETCYKLTPEMRKIWSNKTKN